MIHKSVRRPESLPQYGEAGGNGTSSPASCKLFDGTFDIYNIIDPRARYIHK
jgi:hypothetical protein